MTTVKDFIYRFSNNLWTRGEEVRVDPERCAFQVTDSSLRISMYHQCERKPVEEIDGYLFCRVHARIVKQKLGKHQDTTTRYAASFSYGKPYLAEIQVVRETEHTIDIAEIKALIGDDRLYTGNQNKNSRYTNVFEFFDTADEALGWLAGKARERVDNLHLELERAKKVYEDLMG